MGWIVLVFVASVACLGAALPTGNSDLVREKRTPVAARSMTMDAYMRAQQSQGYNYERPAKRFDPYARTGSGSTPTGSAYGAPGCGNCHQDDKEPSPAAPPTVQEEPQQEVIPERKPKAMAPRVPKRRPVHEEEEDEEEEEAPVSNPRRKTKTSRGPSYSNFFPMMFTGSSGNGRNADGDEGQNPGGLIAIANSFSTGEGAVASSRAVALGSRETNQNRKSSHSRYRS